MSSVRLHARTLLLGAVALGVASLGGDCQGDIVNDPTFRDWCGDTLCAWTLDSGQMSKAPTWNADDFGVSFDQTPTQISQVTSESSAKCILFTTVANVALDAQMMLEVDFDNDGSIDVTQPIDGNWQNFQNEITAPAVYNGITFHIRKEGSGTAILAEMRIQETTGCGGAPVALSNLPLGDGCSADGECASGICSDPLYANPSTACALCSSTHPCANGATCTWSIYGIEECDPGEKKGMPGAACITNSDCESDQCNGVGLRGVPPGFADASCDAGADAIADADIPTCGQPPALVEAGGGSCR